MEQNSLSTAIDAENNLVTRSEDLHIQNARPPRSFLDLPGELRNHVYNILLYELFRRQQRKGVMLWHRSNQSSQAQPDHYHGLTQVCRQIRTEFRPRYLALKQIRVTLKDSIEFLKAYYPKPYDVHGSTQLSGDLVLHVECSERLPGMKLFDTFDFVPLIKSCYVENDIKLRFWPELQFLPNGRPWFDRDTHYALFLSASITQARKTWALAVEHDLSKAILKDDRLSTLQLIFKHNQIEGKERQHAASTLDGPLSLLESRLSICDRFVPNAPCDELRSYCEHLRLTESSWLDKRLPFRVLFSRETLFNGWS